jgi:predicted nucleotidyltransferase component of viral defense system
MLKRIANSEYQRMFVLKGGYLLSIRLGILTRTTNDLDFSIQSEQLDVDRITDIIQEILAIDTDDGIIFELRNKTPIKEGNGIRFNIQARLENIRQSIHIDIATNDPITPGTLTDSYRTIVNKEQISLQTYPYETILAEKLQTVVSLGTASSRAKDLYDLFVIGKMSRAVLDNNDAKLAIETTFEYRDTNDAIQYVIQELHEIKESSIQETLWTNYTRKHYFANGLKLNDVVETIISLVNDLLDM